MTSTSHCNASICDFIVVLLLLSIFFPHCGAVAQRGPWLPYS